METLAQILHQALDTEGCEVLSVPVTIVGTAVGGDNDEPFIQTAVGSSTTVAPTVTVSTTPAYSTGDSIGGKITLTDAVRVSGGLALLQSIMIVDRANQKPTGNILIYNANPAAATLTDNAAVVNSTDDAKVVAIVPINTFDYVTINSKAYAKIRNIGALVRAVGSKNLYASFVVTSTPTFAATTDLMISFDLLHAN